MPTSNSLSIHETLVQTLELCDGDVPTYGWTYGQIICGRVPAQKVGNIWRLSPEAPKTLARLWLGRARRVSPLPAAS